MNDEIFESLLDDMSAEELGGAGASGKLAAASSGTVIGKYRLYLHAENNVKTVYHYDGHLWDIGEPILERTRKIKNCSVWCTPKVRHSDEGPEEDIDIMDRDAVKNVNKSSSFFAQNIQLRFDLDEKKRGDIEYMSTALAEAFMTLDAIVRLCNPDNMKGRTEKLIIQTESNVNPMQWTEGWLQSSEYFRLYRVGTLDKEDSQLKFLSCLNTYASVKFTYDELMSYFGKVQNCSKKLFNEIMNHGGDTRIT